MADVSTGRVVSATGVVVQMVVKVVNSWVTVVPTQPVSSGGQETTVMVDVWLTVAVRVFWSVARTTIDMAPARRRIEVRMVDECMEFEQVLSGVEMIKDRKN